MQVLSHTSDRTIVSIRGMCSGLVFCVCGDCTVEGASSFSVIRLGIDSNTNALPACEEVC
jgi:hypothetical protein